ncbi:MAG: deoxyribonuclease IV [Planctomycetaceae bacterium]|nr:deoxyribonuclease IV [Planctomycetaceae bacterium]
MTRLLGAHMSIAGGYYKAVEAAARLGMTTCQLFTKNNNQWVGKPISDDDVQLFREAIDKAGITSPCAHNSYLINLASPKDELWERSIEAMIVEIQRAELLGLAGIVMHPGSFVESSEEAGLQRIITALDRVTHATPEAKVELWLECTAGQGSCLGHRFEHIASILQGVKEPERYGVCVDTCHIFAAGYPLGTPETYAATMAEFDRTIGLKNIRAFHLNDSKKPLGSRVDRHEHIGEGHLGLEPFRHILNDPRFENIPMYLETEKGERDGEDLDAINLRTLQSLIVPKETRRGAIAS